MFGDLLDSFYGDGDAPKPPKSGDANEPVSDAVKQYLDWFYGDK